MKRGNYVKLSTFLADKKALINMENQDKQCFKWCVVRALNPVAHKSERITKLLRKQAEKLNFQIIEFPTSSSGIDKFEKQELGSRRQTSLCHVSKRLSSQIAKSEKKKFFLSSNHFQEKETLTKYLDYCIKLDLIKGIA